MSFPADSNHIELYANQVMTSVLDVLRKDSLIMNFVNRDGSFAQDINRQFNVGDVININVAPNITTNILTQSDMGSARNYPAYAIGKKQVALSYLAETPYAIPDWNQAITQRNVDQLHVRGAAASLRDSIEQQVVDRMFAVASGTTIGTHGTDFNYNAIARIRTQAQLAKVPRTQRIYLMIHPTWYEKLTLDDKFIKTDYGADSSGANPLRTGLLHPTQNVEIFSTEYVSANSISDSFSGDTGYLGIALTDDSFVVPNRPLPTHGNGIGGATVNSAVVPSLGLSARMTMSYNPNVVGGQINSVMEVLFGADAYRPEHMFPVIGGV